MQQVLKAIADDRLAAYIVWMPLLGVDNREAAETRTGEFTDKRLSYFWDGDKLTGRLWQQTLGLKDVAWDVYFLYGADARWEEAPSLPDFWMHQLSLAQGKASVLNEKEFETKAREMLGKIQ